MNRPGKKTQKPKPVTDVDLMFDGGALVGPCDPEMPPEIECSLPRTNVMWRDVAYGLALQETWLFAQRVELGLNVGWAYNNRQALNMTAGNLAHEFGGPEKQLKELGELAELYEAWDLHDLIAATRYGLVRGYLPKETLVHNLELEHIDARLLRVRGMFGRSYFEWKQLERTGTPPCLPAVTFVLDAHLDACVTEQTCPQIAHTLGCAFPSGQFLLDEAEAFVGRYLNARLTVPMIDQLAQDAIDYVEGKRQAAATPPATASTVGSSP